MVGSTRMFHISDTHHHHRWEISRSNCTDNCSVPEWSHSRARSRQYYQWRYITNNHFANQPSIFLQSWIYFLADMLVIWLFEKQKIEGKWFERFDRLYTRESSKLDQNGWTREHRYSSFLNNTLWCSRSRNTAWNVDSYKIHFLCLFM